MTFFVIFKYDKRPQKVLLRLKRIYKALSGDYCSTSHFSVQALLSLFAGQKKKHPEVLNLPDVSSLLFLIFLHAAHSQPGKQFFRIAAFTIIGHQHTCCRRLSKTSGAAVADKSLFRIEYTSHATRILFCGHMPLQNLDSACTLLLNFLNSRPEQRTHHPDGDMRNLQSPSKP